MSLFLTKLIDGLLISEMSAEALVGTKGHQGLPELI